MIVFELTNTETHPVYQALEEENGRRHYDFLRSIIQASLDIERPFLSQNVIKALNYHAIACLHTHAGEYRPCPVYVRSQAGDIEYEGPHPHRVPALMDDLVNFVNRRWELENPLALAAYVLWRVNHIHPFINGNGRTARAAAYFALCVGLGGLLRGSVILPELIRRPENREEYVNGLKSADTSFMGGGLDISALYNFLARLVEEQVRSA